MEAYKCDRCHEFFTKCDELLVTTVRMSYRRISIKYGQVERRDFDLCPFCKAQLKYWLENPCVVLKEEAKHETSN